jgi:hypothetical protein
MHDRVGDHLLSVGHLSSNAERLGGPEIHTPGMENELRVREEGRGCKIGRAHV